GQKPRKKMIAAFHFDNFALECPRTEQQHYPERTRICPRWSGTVTHSGSQDAQRSCPAGSVADAGLRWCGATPLSTERRISNVEGCEEIIICFDCSPPCQKSLTAAGLWPYHEPEHQSGLQAIPRHRDAAIASGSNDCGYDEGHRLAAALG